jgi:hypothetical protein
MIKDTKGVVRRHISKKGRQCNVQNKDKRAATTIVAIVHGGCINIYKYASNGHEHFNVYQFDSNSSCVIQ